MTNTNNHLVIADERPGGDKACFYCKQPVGHQHRPGCVQRQRTVVVRFTVEMVREVPEDWNRDSLEFHLNESSWCASNLIGDMEKIDTDAHCLCSNVTGEYLREATEDDEKRLGYSSLHTGSGPGL